MWVVNVVGGRENGKGGGGVGLGGWEWKGFRGASMLTGEEGGGKPGRIMPLRKMLKSKTSQRPINSNDKRRIIGNGGNELRRLGKILGAQMLIFSVENSKGLNEITTTTGPIWSDDYCEAPSRSKLPKQCSCSDPLRSSDSYKKYEPQDSTVFTSTGY